LTDGGLETTLIFLEGFDLPCFASFDLLKDDKGLNVLSNYYRRYLEIARDNGFGFILETPTWRANPDWIESTGYQRTAVSELNEKAVELMVTLRDEFESYLSSIVISGCIGPRGDGYQADNQMSQDEAREYHSEQVYAFSKGRVDMVSAITMTYAEEAIGICLAATDVGLPSVISFTVETDGSLPSGMKLKDAVESVDAATSTPPAYYMVNCAHPTHFGGVLADGRDQQWIQRIMGIRANASRKSHVELDESTELDRGDIGEFGTEHQKLILNFPHLNVFGGCCGTDEEHVLEIAKSLTVL
jgi:S-methylmethionine-dependent homocysteine/selenocysteine methylase